MDIEEQPQSNPSSFKRIGLRNSIQTNFGEDYVFQIVPKYVTCFCSLSIYINFHLFPFICCFQSKKRKAEILVKMGFLEFLRLGNGKGTIGLQWRFRCRRMSWSFTLRWRVSSSETWWATPIRSTTSLSLVLRHQRHTCCTLVPLMEPLGLGIRVHSKRLRFSLYWCWYYSDSRFYQFSDNI